ncbi:hypothetical protein J3E69DRAFT_332630 [Trichoderma sp. SZMC 28015]
MHRTSYVVCVYESAKQATTASSTALNGRFGLTPYHKLFFFFYSHTVNVLLASALISTGAALRLRLPASLAIAMLAVHFWCLV